MTNALFIVSEEGYWAEECIEPLTTLGDAGVDVTVATPTGSSPVVDEHSLDPEDLGEDEAERLREIHETDERLADPAALWTAVEGETGKALVVCHAAGLLAFTRDSDGEILAAGRDVTGFPNAWERGIVDEQDIFEGRKLPYWVEDEVTAVGANWEAELDADTSVTVDGDLVTARGPGSSAAAATTLLDELGIEA